MFPIRYFCAGYFAPRYFPEVGGGVAPPSAVGSIFRSSVFCSRVFGGGVT
jgi:hypothetical protein